MKPEEIAALERLCPEAIKMIGLMNAREYDYDIPKQLWLLWGAIATCIVELGELLDRFASNKINSGDWEEIENILGKKFYINRDGGTLNRKERG